MSSSTTPIVNHTENHNATSPPTTTTTITTGGAQGTAIESFLPKVAGGAPARVYLNEKIVPYLLDGMKDIAREQPSNPLKVLGEYLIQKSNEVEQAQNKEQ